MHAAIAAAQSAKAEWASWPWEDRAAVFLKAADLLATTWRDTLNAATMLNQSKTVYQAEIDAACELIDFWRFNVAFARRTSCASSRSRRRRCGTRPTTGRSKASSTRCRRSTSPPSAATSRPTPALMGNTVLWKPAGTAMLGAYYTMKLLEAAGLPPGVINFVPGDPVMISQIALDSPRSRPASTSPAAPACSRACGSTSARTSRSYKSYPRLVGETGGKDFIVAHPSADPQEVAVAMVRGAFEYQGQKCSAASRVYVPKSLWPTVRDRAVAMMREIKMGDTRDFRNFMGAVIDKKAFDEDQRLHRPRASATRKIVQGGGSNGRVGYFIEPTLVQTDNPGYRLLCEEIFGPVLTALRLRRREVRRDAAGGGPDLALRADRLDLRAATARPSAQASAALRNAAGNFYINDKPTGAVVGQQPFGGARGVGHQRQGRARS